MTLAPIYINGKEAEVLLDQATVLHVVETALKELSDERIVNGSKGVHVMLEKRYLAS